MPTPHKILQEMKATCTKRRGRSLSSQVEGLGRGSTLIDIAKNTLEGARRNPYK